MLIDSIVITLVSNMHVGIISTWILSVLLILLGAFYTRVPRFLLIIFFVCFCIAAAAISFLMIFGECDNTNGDEDAIIVLGAGLRGQTPSKLLAARLDAAEKYYRENPNAMIVVSGGQGPDEEISEADAMERYLVKCGVPASSIIKEDRSTSTAENFEFSKELLDKIFDRPYSVVYATSNYHIFRAGLVARSCGIDRSSHIGGDVSWYSIIPCALRECMAIVRFYLP